MAHTKDGLNPASLSGQSPDHPVGPHLCGAAHTNSLSGLKEGQISSKNRVPFKTNDVKAIFFFSLSFLKCRKV